MKVKSFFYRDVKSTFNLPDLNNRFLEGNGSGYIEAGLPNITGQFTSWRGVNVTDLGSYCGITSGAFWRTTGTQSRVINDTVLTSNGTGALNFDASRSSSIYSNSTTVQPPTCKCYFCIKF